MTPRAWTERCRISWTTRCATAPATSRFRATGGDADVTVTDEGAGFARRTSAADGDGLGLTIVREIVRAHGGKVDVQRNNGRTRVRVEVASLST